MGTPYQRLMVASDGAEGIDTALERAVRLAGADSRIRVLQPCYDPVTDEPAEVLSSERRAQLREAVQRRHREDLEALIQPYRSRAVVDPEVPWAPRAADAIVDQAARWPAQLLIKPVSRHHPVADYFHTPLDWALMRRAPCPVLVCKGDAPARPGPVLAAVDVGDTRHAALCREIIRQAAVLAGALEVELHVATAYPDLGQTVNQLQVATDFAGIKADMRDSRRRAVAQLLADLDGTDAPVHLLEGPPGRVIAELADTLGAVVTVLGSAARSGVAKLIIGNTAEDLIGRLRGDLLTVREPWS